MPLLPLAGVPFADAVEAILAEAFVRNVRWALRACPALADTDDGSAPAAAVSAANPLSSGGDDSVSPREAFRLRQVLAANAVSLRLLAFHCTAAVIVAADCGAGASPEAQGARLEATKGLPSAAAVLQLQRCTRGLKGGPQDWGAFFRGVGLPEPRKPFLAAWLRTSVKRSAALGYHHHGAALRAAAEAEWRATEDRRFKSERSAAAAEAALEAAAEGKVQARGGRGKKVADGNG